MHYSREEIIQAARNAGIVGSGGAGFPTYIKLSSNVDTIIANGSECEPLLMSDKELMKDSPAYLIEGVKLAMIATGATKGYIAIKGCYEDVVAAVAAELPDDNTIEIHELENYYPAGDEYMTVYDVTGKVIPEGSIPPDVGVMVSNVLTFIQIAQSVSGKKVTERALTVTGEVNNPQVMSVPIGTSYNDVLKLAGGISHPDAVVMDGGPMMGEIVTDLDRGIAKTTSGLVVLPREHLIVRQKTKTLSQMVKLSKAACCQCTRCTDLCPRHLLGHDLHPHMTMRTIDYNLTEPTKHITSAFLCSQCGLCEMISCDSMLLSPKKIYAEYKKLLLEKGIKNPHNKKTETRDHLNERKVSIPMVIKKLNLGEYYNKKPLFTGRKETLRTRIATNRHIGVPAIPIVGIGEKVKIGDMIAKSPDEKVGTIYHASIKGEIMEITHDEICIRKVGSR
ncbi:MAG: SLBB domain-containing protein [Bacteriovoracaceae bacterium]|nr:SLBB domain-containing protein [Bacteriovoracaceae bacterium]